MMKSQKRGRAQNHQNGLKWVQNGRQVLRIGPLASPGHFLASGTGPAAQNLPKQAQKPRSARSRPPTVVPRFKTDTVMLNANIECPTSVCLVTG